MFVKYNFVYVCNKDKLSNNNAACAGAAQHEKSQLQQFTQAVGAAEKEIESVESSLRAVSDSCGSIIKVVVKDFCPR